MRRLAIVVMLACAVIGCSNLKGRRVLPELAKTEDAKGVSYYLAKPRFAIIRKTQRDGKPAIPRFDLEVTWEPDPLRRYEVGMRAGIFTSDSFELQLNSEGTAMALSSKRTDEVGKAIVGLSNVAAEVAKAVAGEAGAAAKTAAVAGSKKTLRTPAASPTPTPTLPVECTGLCGVVEGCAGTLEANIGAAFRQMGAATPCAVATVSAATAAASPTPDPEPQIIAQYRCLEKLNVKRPSIAGQLAKLKSELATAIAKAIAEHQSNSLEVKALKDQIRDALNLIDDRALRGRRDALERALTTRPDLKNYVALSAEMDRMVKDLNNVKAIPDDPDSEAIDVTSKIDRGVYIDARCSPLVGLEKEYRAILAKARIRVGLADAVVITAPAL